MYRGTDRPTSLLIDPEATPSTSFDSTDNKAEPVPLADNPVWKVTATGIKMKAGFFAECYRPVTLPLEAVTLFTVNFATEYSRTNNAGRAFIEATKKTTGEFILSRITPFPLGVILSIGGGAASYVKHRQSADMYKFEEYIFSQELMDISGGKEGMELVLFGDLFDGRKDINFAVEGWAFFNEVNSKLTKIGSDLVSRAIDELIAFPSYGFQDPNLVMLDRLLQPGGSSASGIDKALSGFKSQLDNLLGNFGALHVTELNKHQPNIEADERRDIDMPTVMSHMSDSENSLMRFAPGANGDWYPLDYRFAGIQSSIINDSPTHFRLTEAGELVITRAKDLQVESLPRSAAGGRREYQSTNLIKKESGWDNIAKSLTYEGRRYSIEGKPVVRLTETDEIVIGLNAAFGAGMIVVTPFVSLGIGFAIAAAQFTALKIREKKITKITNRIKNHGKELELHIGKMLELQQKITQACEAGDLSAAADNINAWREFRPVMIGKIEQLEKNYRRLNDKKHERKLNRDRLENLKYLKDSSYIEDARHDVILAINDSRVMDGEAQLAEQMAVFNGIAAIADRQFVEFELGELKDSALQLDAVGKNIDTMLDELRERYQSLAREVETIGEDSSKFSRQAEEIDKLQKNIKSDMSKLPRFIEHLTLKKNLLISRGILSIVRLALYNIDMPYQRSLIDVSHLITAMLVSEYKRLNVKIKKLSGRHFEKSDLFNNDERILSGLQITNILLNLSDNLLGDRLGPKFKLALQGGRLALKAVESGVLIAGLYRGKLTLTGGVVQSFLGLFDSGLNVWTHGRGNPLISTDPYYLFEQTLMAKVNLFALHYNQQQSFLSACLSEVNDLYNVFSEYFPVKVNMLSRGLSNLSERFLNFIPEKNHKILGVLSLYGQLSISNIISQFIWLNTIKNVVVSFMDTKKSMDIERLMHEGKFYEAYEQLEEILKKDPTNKVAKAQKGFYKLQQKLAVAELFVWGLSNAVDYFPEEMQTPYLSPLFSIMSQLFQRYNAFGMQALKQDFINEGQFSFHNLYGRGAPRETPSNINKSDIVILMKVTRLILSVVEFHSDMTEENKLNLQKLEHVVDIVSHALEIASYDLNIMNMSMVFNMSMLSAGLVSSICRLYRSFRGERTDLESSFSYSLMSIDGIEAIAYKISANPILGLYSKAYMTGVLIGRAQVAAFGLNLNVLAGDLMSMLSKAGITKAIVINSLYAAAAIKTGVDVINLYREYSYRNELLDIDKMIRKGDFDAAVKKLEEEFKPWEEDSNAVISFLFGKDWTEEKIQRNYLFGLVLLNQEGSPIEQKNKLDSFLRFVEDSSLTKEKKSNYINRFKQLIKQLEINGLLGVDKVIRSGDFDAARKQLEKDFELWEKSAGSDGKSWTEEGIYRKYLFHLVDLNQKNSPKEQRNNLNSLLKIISNSSLSEEKKANHANNAKRLMKQLEINVSRRSMFLLDCGMRMLRFFISSLPMLNRQGVPYLSPEVNNILPFVSRLMTLVQELTINEYSNFQRKLRSEGEMLVEKNAITRQNIGRDIQPLSTWYGRLIYGGDRHFVARMLNTSLLLLNDRMNFDDKSNIKRTGFNIVLLMSESALLWLQYCHQYQNYKAPGGEGNMVDEIFSSTTFYTIAQTLSVASRLVKLIQDYDGYPDWKESRLVCMLSALIYRFNTDRVFEAYSYYLTAFGFFNLYPDWKFLLSDWQWLSDIISWMSPVLENLLEFKASFIDDNVSYYISLITRLLLVGYLVYTTGFQKGSVYQQYKLQMQCMDAEKMIVDRKFNEAHLILETIENDSMHIKLMKAMASLYKDAPESKRAGELIMELSEKTTSQTVKYKEYSSYIVSLSLGIVRQCKNMSLSERKLYLQKADAASAALLTQEPDDEVRKLERLNVIEHFVSLSLEDMADMKENDSDREDLLREAISRAKTFVSDDNASRKVLYLANLIVGNANFILQQYNDGEKYLEHALNIIKEEEVVSENPTEDIVQLLSQLAQSACKQRNWPVALRRYEEMETQPNLTVEQRDEINQYKQELQRRIQYSESSRPDASLLSSMGMFTTGPGVTIESIADQKYDDERLLLRGPAPAAC